VSAADERKSLLRLAEIEDDPTVALSAFMLGHGRLQDPSNSAGWMCGCLHQGALGESHARHQAEALLTLLWHRGWSNAGLP